MILTQSQVDTISEILHRGNTVEIKKVNGQIQIIEIRRKCVRRDDI